MAAAVIDRTFVHPQSLACSSAGPSYCLKKGQTSSPTLLGGTSIQYPKRVGVKVHPKLTRHSVSCNARGKYDPTRKKPIDPIDDPFNFGEDEDMEYGSLMSSGKQSFDLVPPTLKRNERGFIQSPAFYNLETASLGPYIRGDVRRCLCWVAGDVYENLLFFPAIQLLRNRYPGVEIDVVANERGKQVYEMNKYIRKAFVFDTDAGWTVPAELMAFLSELRMEFYDMVLSTTYAGFKHASFLFMLGGRAARVSYVPAYHSEWVSTRFLSEAIEAPREILGEGGYNMYEEILSYVARPWRDVPQEPIPPLQVGINRRVRSVVRQKENDEGLSEGKFVVFHGIESDSEASMTSRGDTDSLLPLHLLGQLKKQLQVSPGVKVVVVIPHKRERSKIVEVCGSDVSIVYITTPGQLGALIKDSIGVVSTNTAAMQIAVALNKPSVALFGSSKKASLFVPPNANNIMIVTSKTGKLADIDIDDATSAWKSITQGQLVLAA